MKKKTYRMTILTDDFRKYLLAQTGFDPYEPDIEKRKIWFGYDYVSKCLTVCVKDDIKLDIDSIVEKYNPLPILQKNKLNELKQLFVSLISQTDYIYVKSQDLGADVSSLYPNKLKWRKHLRVWYKNKKASINNATTQQEIYNIEINDYPQIPKKP